MNAMEGVRSPCMQRKRMLWQGVTCQEGQAMGGSVIELVSEEHQAPHQQDGKDYGAPQPPVLPQLLPNTLAQGGRAARCRPLC